MSRPDTSRGKILQFLKYCVVGLSNFAVDAVISYALTYGLNLLMVVANTTSFFCAACNSFYWNGRWTFRGASREKRHRQFMIFLAVNIIGAGLEIMMMALVYYLFGFRHTQRPPSYVWLTAKFAATGVVVFWNFFASKKWAFKH